MSVHLTAVELEAIDLVRGVSAADFYPRLIAKIHRIVVDARAAGWDDDEIQVELLGEYHDIRHRFPMCYYIATRAVIRLVIAETAEPGPVDPWVCRGSGVDGVGRSA